MMRDQADQALYAAKRDGRNCVRIYEHVDGGRAVSTEAPPVIGAARLSGAAPQTPHIGPRASAVAQS